MSLKDKQNFNEDTIALINQIYAIQYFTFASTAGGAFLEFLEGKNLPGIKALN